MIYFVFWVFTNSILLTSYSIILYHDYLDKRKKIFRKDLQSVLVFRVGDNDDDDDDDDDDDELFLWYGWPTKDL